MSISIKYDCDGRTAVWPVPFAYARESEIGVKVLSPDGTERILSAGRDYIVNEHAVICVQPAGMKLCIWQDGAEPEPAALTRAAASRASSAAMSTGAAGPQYVATSTEESLPDIPGETERAIAQINSWKDIAIEKIRAELSGELGTALESVRQTLASAMREVSLAAQDTASANRAAISQTESLAEQAGRAAATAQAATMAIDQARGAQDNAASTAQAWADASRQSAEQAHDGAVRAWEAATQASIHAERPGVCAVARCTPCGRPRREALQMPFWWEMRPRSVRSQPRWAWI